MTSSNSAFRSADRSFTTAFSSSCRRSCSGGRSRRSARSVDQSRIRSELASCQRTGHRALPAVAERLWAQWRLCRSRDERESVIEHVPPPRRADCPLEQPHHPPRQLRTRRQLDLRSTNGARADELPDERVLFVVVTPTLALGGQAVGCRRSSFPILASGAYNELQAGYTSLVSGFRPTVRQPLILVTVPGTSGAPVVLQSGTHEIATGQRNETWTAELTDNLSISVGAHRVDVSASRRSCSTCTPFSCAAAYGIWEFASLDSLRAGTASRYRVTRDTGSVTAASGAYHAALSWAMSGKRRPACH